MSEPSFCIDLSIGDMTINSEKPWTAYVTRLSDDQLVSAKAGRTSNEALQAALDYIVSAPDAQSWKVYADEDGNVVSAPEPQSLRA